MFRKYSYEDLDEDVYTRSERSSRDVLQVILVVIAAFGGALIFLVLLFTYYAVLYEHHKANSGPGGILAGVAPAPGTDDPDPVIIQLAKGAIEGKRMSTREGREYLAFLGVPYARPPLGELRFKPPVEEDPWNGTLIAKEFKPRCIQKKSSRESYIVGEEDCLYLNVFTPKTLQELTNHQGEASDPKEHGSGLPVMVYIHGGLWGAFGHVDRNGAAYLLDEDVILVTHHYRLGALGNLNTMDRHARGNQGLKDTVMALKWVQNNIERFGGDPTRVTLFGESYGSMMTSVFLISPMAKGLFHRAICQSGSILMPGLLASNTLDKAFILGSKLNCTASTSSEALTSQELVACLQHVDAESLVTQSHTAPLGETEFTMSVEADVGGSEPNIFLPDFPLNLYQNGSSINTIPVIFGTTSAELLGQSLAILSCPELTDVHNQNWSQVLVNELNLDIASERPEELATAIHAFYMGSANFSTDTERNFTFMLSDRSYIHPTTVSANFQLQTNRATSPQGVKAADVYLYQFNYPVDRSYMQPIMDEYGSEEFLGVGHADELQFLFPYGEPTFPLIPVDHKDYAFSRMMVRLWTSFAANGVPEAEWTPLTGSKPHEWFRLESQPHMITNEDRLADRMQFWDSFNLTELYI